MVRSKLFHLFSAIIVLLSLIPSAAQPGVAAPAQSAPPTRNVIGPSAPQSPLDTPFTLVASGADKYTIGDPKVFWYTGVLECPPRGPQSPTDTLEEIQRIPTYGGISRALYQRNAACGTGDVLSNLATDGVNLYWVSLAQNGLVKLSVDANPGDAPTLISSAVSGGGEVLPLGGSIYVLISGATGSLWEIGKDGSFANKIVANTGSYPYDLQTDGGNMYWITGGVLEQWDLYYQSLWSPGSGVTAYVPDAGDRGVYFAQGDKVTFFSNYDNAFYPVLPGGDASNPIVEMVTDATNIYYFTRRQVNCNPFCSLQYALYRVGKDATGLSLIYIYNPIFQAPFPGHLIPDGNYLFWGAGGGVVRMAKNASAIPLVSLRVTGLEITQAIQDTNNSVQLVENKRTFVRVYAKSDGGAVPGVTAYLYLIDGNGFPVAGPLVPSNPVGQTITLWNTPNRDNLNDAFLFELPWNWTTGSIRLRAVINPNGIPPQVNYNNNQIDSTTFTFKASPRLAVQFVAFGYVLNNQTYYPRFVKDIIQTYSWVRRVYPLASTGGFIGDPSPGFRPNLWLVGDDNLGSRVNATDSSCKDNLCAARYTNNLLKQMRVDEGLSSSLFMYGMISDAAGFFPRGIAGGGGSLVSSGPAGSKNWGWDNDGSYADWYAGHEIGHTLGRDHPWTGSSLDDSVCGQTPNDGALDKSYPYPDSQLGKANSTTFEGFDTGDGEMGIQPAIYPQTTWHDNMSYCGTDWISNYTFNGMYDYMIAHPSAPASFAPQAVRVTGDLLSVFGEVLPDSNKAIIDILRRQSSVGWVPPITPGAYSIRLVGPSGTLADYAFTPAPMEGANETTLDINQVVNFVPGTTQVQIVKLAGNVVLGSRAVSPHAPVVSNVALQGAPNPVSGTVTLGWTASDADGDPLSFDVLYSRDGGTTFQPLMSNLKGSSAQIDTSRLGGSGSAVLRVTASDGVNTSSGDSAPFTMANKPPIPTILLPQDGLHVHYGQLVNFSGQVEDFQDTSMSGDHLVWSNQNGTLGSGALLSTTGLPVGTNHIRLTATDSLNLSAYTEITVYVDDNLDLPGPVLTAAPTQVSVHVDAGATTPQTADVTIGNAGAGTLSWTAQSGAPWLKLSAASGTAPATLTLTLDPAGMKDGGTLTTNLVITSPAAPDHAAETLTIPVGLAMGDLQHNGPGGTGGNGGKRLYLPLVDR